MIQLTQAFVNNDTKNYVNHGANVLVHFSNMSFGDVSQVLLQKHMLQRENIFVKFEQHLYLDELFLNDNLRTDFEEMMFSILEYEKPSHRFLYFIFKIKSSDIDELIHNGFYEWIEFWMLFFRLTKLNLLFETDSGSFISNKCPLIYEFVKKIDNPRLSISINNLSKVSKENVFPEDINAYVILFNNNSITEAEQFPYARFYINEK